MGNSVQYRLDCQESAFGMLNLDRDRKKSNATRHENRRFLHLNFNTHARPLFLDDAEALSPSNVPAGTGWVTEQLATGSKAGRMFNVHTRSRTVDNVVVVGANITSAIGFSPQFSTVVVPESA